MKKTVFILMIFLFLQSCISLRCTPAGHNNPPNDNPPSNSCGSECAEKIKQLKAALNAKGSITLTSSSFMTGPITLHFNSDGGLIFDTFPVLTEVGFLEILKAIPIASKSDLVAKVGKVTNFNYHDFTGGVTEYDVTSDKIIFKLSERLLVGKDSVIVMEFSSNKTEGAYAFYGSTPNSSITLEDVKKLSGVITFSGDK